MDKQWYYNQDGAQYGPVDEAVIVRLIRDGELPTGTPVLQEGSTDWKPARNHACFQVEIYLKKKRPSVKAAKPTTSKAASTKSSQSSRQTAQKSTSARTSQSPKKRTDQSAETTPSTAPKPAGTTTLEQSGKLKEKGKSGLFSDVMMEVDWSVGQSLDTLGKHKPDKSTLAIFTADTKKPLLMGGIMVGVVALIVLVFMVYVDRTVTIPNSPEAAAAIEEEIRKEAKKPEGELTKADLERVRGLNLENKQITDVSPLAGLKQLGKLSLTKNRLTDIKPLAGLTQLINLGLGFNKLTNEQLKHLAGLTQLMVLDLRSNQLTDLSALAWLKQLETLNLSHNNITDLSALAGLTQLRTLDLSDNPKLTKAEISKLEKALPECNISHDFN